MSGVLPARLVPGRHDRRLWHRLGWWLAAALTDWISLGVLASAVPRDAVDDAVEAAGKGAKRAGGKLPPHVMVYFAMALALFADDDYEEVVARLAGTLPGWGCWDEAWEVPTSGGITQARQRLGYEPLGELFAAGGGAGRGGRTPRARSSGRGG